MSLSTGGATLTAYLKDDRERETDQVVKEWKKLLNQVTGANISVDASSSSSMMSSSTGKAEYILQSSQYDELKEASDEIANALMEHADVARCTRHWKRSAGCQAEH